MTIFVATDAGEGEDILVETGFVGPVGGAGAVGGDFAGGAAGLVFREPALAPAPTAAPALGGGEAGGKEKGRGKEEKFWGKRGPVEGVAADPRQVR